MLTRSSYLAKLAAASLSNQGIPVHAVGSAAETFEDDVQHILSALKATINPSDSLHLANMITKGNYDLQSSALLAFLERHRSTGEPLRTILEKSASSELSAAETGIRASLRAIIDDLKFLEDEILKSISPRLHIIVRLPATVRGSAVTFKGAE